MGVEENFRIEQAQSVIAVGAMNPDLAAACEALDAETVETIVSAYLEDAALQQITVTDAQGNVLVQLDAQAETSSATLILAESPIYNKDHIQVGTLSGGYSDLPLEEEATPTATDATA